MINWAEITLRLALAALLGAVIGLERERKDWAAGLRTHMMVCLGSSLIMMVSTYGFSDVLGSPNITLDPSRIAAQVISGIGFIGAGTILFLRQGIVRGLTTASGLWTVAGIGLAAGGGMYFAAAIATVSAVIILWALQPVEKILSDRFKHKGIRIVTKNREKSIEIVNQLFENKHLEVASFLIDKSDNEFTISFRFKSLDKSSLATLVGDFQQDPDIKEITWNG